MKFPYNKLHRLQFRVSIKEMLHTKKERCMGKHNGNKHSLNYDESKLGIRIIMSKWKRSWLGTTKKKGCKIGQFMFQNNF